MSADAQPNPKQRANEKTEEEPAGRIAPQPKERAQVGTLCVVCGDRACSHLYYGVAACHGCKCFFWRTVKSRLSYSCRYQGQCNISTAGRNACRYCRFTRCLGSGMKLDAVRMDKEPKSEKAGKRKKAEIDSDEHDDNQENIASPTAKRQRMDNRLLASSLLLIDRTARDGDERRVAAGGAVRSLQEAMMWPEILDGDRTEMRFRCSMPADATACGRSERRLLVWAMDWTRQASEVEEDAISNEDKVSLLRACYAPLCLLELGCRSLDAPESLLPLPDGTYLHRDAPLPKNCFLNDKLLSSLLNWSHRQLKVLQLSPKELVLLKALIVLNPDAAGVSPSGSESVSETRSRLQSALFQFCSDVHGADYGARRLASMLMLLPQLQVISMEFCEHIRMRNTFCGSFVDPLGCQMFGDIFDHHEDGTQLHHSASCSPLSSVSDSS